LIAVPQILTHNICPKTYIVIKSIGYKKGYRTLLIYQYVTATPKTNIRPFYRTLGQIYRTLQK
jgi:hypothetical protein